MDKTIILGADSWYPQVDGVTNVVVNYHKILKEQNRCVIVAPSYGKKQDKMGEERYCSEVFHNLSMWVPFLGFRNSTPRNDKKLRKLLDDLHPDILHAHSPFAICSYFIRYGKKHNIPVVYTFHTKYEDEFMRVTRSRLITKIIMKIIMRNINRADYVWAVSQSSAKTLASYGYKGDIKIMRNGTEMGIADDTELDSLSALFNSEYNVSHDERILMYAGRVVAVKNLKFTFSVLAELKRRRFKFRFFVVGGGDELEAHKKLAAKMGVADMVEFTGFVGDREQLRKFYARADLFMLPSLFDTFGLVILEAASCRTPSIVPENSCAAELLKDNETGYIAKLDVNLWADKIENLFGADYERVRNGCTSVVTSWNSSVAEAQLEYDKIIAANKK